MASLETARGGLMVSERRQLLQDGEMTRLGWPLGPPVHVYFAELSGPAKIQIKKLRMLKGANTTMYAQHVNT